MTFEDYCSSFGFAIGVDCRYGWLVSWFVFNGTLGTNRLWRAMSVCNIGLL